MPYYVRVLSPEATVVPQTTLSGACARFNCRLESITNSGDWRDLEVNDASGEVLFTIERNEVADDSLAAGEISDFIDEVSECLPKSGADWLRNFLPRVKTIYAMQILDAIDRGNGWAVLGAVKEAIWHTVGDIFQADGEGFSNDDGYHILWQFSETVSGDWWMAVLRDGEWQRYKMDLADPLHRAAFEAGLVPQGVERA